MRKFSTTSWQARQDMGTVCSVEMFCGRQTDGMYAALQGSTQSQTWHGTASRALLGCRWLPATLPLRWCLRQKTRTRTPTGGATASRQAQVPSRRRARKGRTALRTNLEEQQHKSWWHVVPGGIYKGCQRVLEKKYAAGKLQLLHITKKEELAHKEVSSEDFCKFVGACLHVSLPIYRACAELCRQLCNKILPGENGPRPEKYVFLILKCFPAEADSRSNAASICLWGFGRTANNDVDVRRFVDSEGPMHLGQHCCAAACWKEASC